MAIPKEYEYIVKFEPYYLENNKGELCFMVHTVQKLIRCKDCKWYHSEDDGYCDTWGDTQLNEMDYCSYGKEEE